MNRSLPSFDLATSRIVRAFLAVTLLTVVGCGGSAEPDPADSDPVLAKGKKIYEVQCLMCHQAKGEGMPDLQPPIAGSAIVLGDPGPLVHWILGGSAAKQGESEYSNFMPPFNMLSDEDVAAVSSYIRNAFGNEASRIEADQVATLRAEYGG